MIFQVSPPFALRKTPSKRSEFSLASSVAKAYSTWGFDGLIARLVRPNLVGSGNPLVRCVHFFPPSVDRHIPLPAPSSVNVAKMVPFLVGWKTTEWHE